MNLKFFQLWTKKVPKFLNYEFSWEIFLKIIQLYLRYAEKMGRMGSVLHRLIFWFHELVTTDKGLGKKGRHPCKAV
jgi:hypothetical protein